MTYWSLSHRADPFARKIADRHYNRQKIGTPQFVPPGRCMVLTADTDQGRALWVTSWPFAEYVKHQWPGAWICSAFRNESELKSSKLIKSAVAATLHYFGKAPELGMITFVDTSKTRPKADPGHCYIIAGFRPCGMTKGGLVALQLTPDKMPAPAPASGFQLSIFAEAA
jgi:hypothetical protein